LKGPLITVRFWLLRIEYSHGDLSDQGESHKWIQITYLKMIFGRLRIRIVFVLSCDDLIRVLLRVNVETGVNSVGFTMVRIFRMGFHEF
jgi:hypothetical protein